MVSQAKEKTNAILALIEKYKVASQKEIDKLNLGLLKPLEYPALINKLEQLKSDINKLNTDIEKLIEDDHQNKDFYEAHRNNILQLILNANIKYNKGTLLASDFVHRPVTTIPYKKRGRQDLLPVMAYWSCKCILIASLVAAIGLAAGMMAIPPIFPMQIIAATIAALALALASIIVLLGPIIGIANYLTSDTPKRSTGDTWQIGRNRSLFYSLSAMKRSPDADSPIFDYRNLQTVFKLLRDNKIPGSDHELVNYEDTSLKSSLVA